ncbi:MAG: hypothetical protein EOO43_17060 [Flavobacterium sp.]|nr:MAG: hypothetical protein EOO43_17060 [Flavobacterium sp.]
MVNYALGKVYKIIDNTNGNAYVGSTGERTLARRLSTHVKDYRRYLKGNKNFITSFDILENGNYSIILIENYSCDSKDQLRARERYYIENTECVNKVIPGRTKKEYRLDNKERIRKAAKEYRSRNREHITEIKKEYRSNNRERIKECRSMKYECPVCGSICSKSSKARHEKTKKYQSAINTSFSLEPS